MRRITTATAIAVDAQNPMRSQSGAPCFFNEGTVIFSDTKIPVA
jgi:hypothetical protein